MESMKLKDDEAKKLPITINLSEKQIKNLAEKYL